MPTGEGAGGGEKPRKDGGRGRNAGKDGYSWKLLAGLIGTQ